MRDPCGPGKGNQLPYVDKVWWLVITDYSTRIAALRTARTDLLGHAAGDVFYEDAELLMKTHPNIQWRKLLLSSPAIYLRTDTKPLTTLELGGH